ncbi:MAG: HNH endonuclease, partial [Gammaproteobacteria bacterium]|nr:HNH endonuclease [Gammaproteobacteria bacterium]
AAQLEERCREMRNGEPESVAGARRAWERRSLTLRRDAARGTMCISVEVPLEDGELIAQALERAVEAGEAASEHEFGTMSGPPGVRDAAEARSAPGNGWYAQQADALVAVAKAYLSGNDDAAKASSTADRYQVVVHVEESALRGGAGRSDLPVETVKRLCCDGSLIALVEDERGSPLDVGRNRRTLTTRLRRALWSRDRGCTFPGCDRKRYVDGHHIRHWANGGETSLDNTALLCTYHHMLVHEGGFTMGRAETGELYFRRPDGRVIPRGGYRLEDMVDDFATEDDGAVGANASAEVRSPSASAEVRTPSASAEARTSSASAEVRSPSASAEVRESRAVYRVARRAFGRMAADLAEKPRRLAVPALGGARAAPCAASRAASTAPCGRNESASSSHPCRPYRDS